MYVRPSSLHLSAALPGSGSDIAAQRLCKALTASGSRADWLSLSTYRKGDSPDHPSNHLFWTRSSRNSRLLSRALDRLDYRRTGIHLSLTPGLRTRPLNNWPVDLIHLHWLGTGFLSLFSLKHLSKPLVWTLHDLWPIQGVLPYPPTDGAPSRGMGLDFDPMMLFLKRRLLPHRVQFIAPSSWAARVAEKSPVFASFANPRPIVVIPNSVDSTFFDSVPAGRPSQASRHHMLLFGGSNVFSDRRKGWHLLKPLLPWLASSYPHWRIASFGELPPPELRFSPQWQHLGLLKGPHELARLYRSADLLVMPSQQETFGRYLAEGLLL